MTDYHVPSVSMAAQALKLLARYKYRSCTLTELSEALHVSKTTCLRVMRTLVNEDFVHYDEATKKYGLGPYLIPLGNRASELINSVACATQEMRKVAAATGMTTVLVQRMRDDRLMYIATAEAPRDEIRISVSVGQQFPLTAAAFGRCFLAFESEEEWEKYTARGLQKYTEGTVTDPLLWRRRLLETRKRGYAVSHGESREGLSAIAAPIFGGDDVPLLVMACIAFTSQLRDEDLEDVVNTLLPITKRLSMGSFHAFASQV